MPSINFPASTLQPTPCQTSDVSKKGLRRVSSSPELSPFLKHNKAAQEDGDASKCTSPHPEESESSCYGSEPYNVGNTIKLRLRAYPGSKPRIVKAEIIRIFAPFTMAPVMVVRVHEPALDLEGDFVLKVFDRRFTKDFRKDFEMESWSLEKEKKYQCLALSDKLATFRAKFENNPSLWATGEEENGDLFEEDGVEGEEKEKEDEDEDDEWDDAHCEVWVHNVCQKMYKAESEVYHRPKSLHGIDVPRLIACVEVSDYYVSSNCSADLHVNTHDVPGVLIQYIDSFSLFQLYREFPGNEPPVPKFMCQYICDDAVRAINKLIDHEILNMDVNIRNALVHWDPILLRYKVKMIDFGHCRFKGEDESERDWRERLANEDQEGAIGIIMQHGLQRDRGGGYHYERTPRAKQLIYDFMGEHPRI